MPASQPRATRATRWCLIALPRALQPGWAVQAEGNIDQRPRGGSPSTRRTAAPLGAGASGQGGFARPRKACWRIFAARRKQALRGSRVRPPGLCLSVAHPRYRGSRAFLRRRGLAGHALMPTSGGQPSGARAISRPFLRKFLNFFQPNNSMRAWVGHLFKAVYIYWRQAPGSDLTAD